MVKEYCGLVFTKQIDRTKINSINKQLETEGKEAGIDFHKLYVSELDKLSKAKGIVKKPFVRKEETTQPIIEPTSNKLNILKKSLEKKEKHFERIIKEHLTDVTKTNGEPLNDKRNGQAIINRWNRQSDSILNSIKEVEKTENAIRKENNKLYNLEFSKTYLPPIFMELVNKGDLIQWRKHPNIFFVPGVDKARIVWDKKKNIVVAWYSRLIVDQEQKIKFFNVIEFITDTIKGYDKSTV